MSSIGLNAAFTVALAICVPIAAIGGSPGPHPGSRFVASYTALRQRREIRAKVVLTTEGSLLHSPGPATTPLYLSPLTYNHTLLGPLAASSNASSAWYFTQWSNVHPFTAPVVNAGLTGCDVTGHADVSWNIASDTMRVCSAGGGSDVIVELAQNGRDVPIPCGVEFDAFIAPTDDAYDNAPPNFDTFIPLGNLTSLTVAFDVQLPYAAITPRCGTSPQCSPSPDYSYAVLGLVLDNVVRGQTNFYQVILYDSRSSDCPNNDPCGNFSYWYFDTLPTLGVSDSIALVTGDTSSCLAPGAPQPSQFVLPMLPILLQRIAFAAEKFGADPDPAHWAVHGLYIGTGLQGSAVTTFHVGSVNLTYTTQ